MSRDQLKAGQMFPDPVVIVGAPRSGTTLLQMILREQSGMASLPAESEYIWSRFTHPSLNDWFAEGWTGTELDAGDRRWISRQFRRYALPAGFWRNANPSVRTYRRKPWKARMLRAVFHAGMKVRGFVWPLPPGFRLVEKSVNSALYLPLIRAVFPDARFVFVTRNPADAIRSIRDGWKNPDRFETFDVPLPLQIQGYQGQRWNFALPSGWQSVLDRSVDEVAAYQWCALNEAAMAFGRQHADSWLHLRLEDLVSDASVTERLATFVNLDPAELERSLSRHGHVNASTKTHDGDMAVDAGMFTGEVDALAERLGYPR